MDLRIGARVVDGAYELSAEPVGDDGDAIGREAAASRVEWAIDLGGGFEARVEPDDPRLLDGGWGIRMPGEARTVTARLVEDEEEVAECPR